MTLYNEIDTEVNDFLYGNEYRGCYVDIPQIGCDLALPGFFSKCCDTDLCNDLPLPSIISQITTSKANFLMPWEKLWLSIFIIAILIRNYF